MPDPAGNRSPTPNERLRLLFETHHRALLAYAARRCATLDDAEDVVAEVFSVAWRRLEVVPEGDAAVLWLYGVARKTVANQRRGGARQTRLRERMAATTPRPSVSDGAGDDGAALDALARLSASDQELLRLVAWEELNHAEIAQVLGISVNAVAIRLHRARQRFGESLVKGSGRWRTWTSVKGSLARRASREEP